MKILNNLLVKAGVIVDNQVAIGTNSPFAGYTIDARGSNNFGSTSSELYHYFSSANVSGGSALTVLAANTSANSGRSHIMLTDTTQSVLSRFGLGVYTGTGMYAYLDSASKLVINNASGANVIIGGTTDAGYKFDVYGSGRFQSFLNVNHVETNIAALDVRSTNRDITAYFDNTRATGTNYAGIFQASGVANNIAGYFNATYGTTNVAIKADYGDVILNNASGTTRVGSLSGTGSRIVVADANGVLSTSTAAIGSYLTGSGTTNYVPKWTPNGTTLGDSQIFDNGTRVGIGTTSPALKLDVAGSIRTDAVLAESSAPAITAQLNTNHRQSIRMSISGTDGVIQVTRNSGPHPNLLFSTEGGERMRITSGGSLYFKGTSTTTHAEAIIENDNTSVNLYASASGSINKELRFYFNATSSGERIRIFNNGRVFIGPTPTDGGYQLDVAGTLRSTLGANFATSSGNVGVGVTSASYKLHVKGPALDYTGLFFANTEFIALGQYNVSAGTMAIESGSNLAFLVGASTERMRITTGGTVAIGNNTSIAANTILQTAQSGDQTIRFAHTDNAIGRTVTLRLTNTNASYSDAGVYIRAIQGSGIDNYSMALGTTGVNQTAATERIRINNAGNVGIGTDAPAFRLDVQNLSGSGSMRIKGGTGANQGAAYYVTNAGNTGTLLAIGDRASILGGTVDTSASIYTASGVPLLLDVGGTERARITSAGLFGIGSQSPQQILHANATAGAYLQLSRTAQGSTASPFGGIYFGDGTTFQEAAILSYADGDVVSGSIEFYTRAAAGALLQRLKIASAGTITASSLAGTGTRMVVADANGVLSTQSISGGVVLGTGTTNYVPKWTSSSGLGNSQIFDDGTNVGIGLPSTGAKLHVRGSNSYLASFNTTVTTSSVSFIGLGNFSSYNPGSAGVAFSAYHNLSATAAADMGLHTHNGTSMLERVRIFANGRVGINTGATDYGDYMLQVVGNTYISGFLNLGSGSTAANFTRIWTANGYSYYGTEGSAGGEISAGTSPYFNVIRTPSGAGTQIAIGATISTTFAANGSVGIGTTSPSEKLDVSGNARVGGTGNPTFTISSTSGAYSSLLYLNAAGGGGANIYANGGNNNLYINNNNVVTAVFTSNQKLLVNTTTDAGAYNLQVVGNVYTNSNLVVDGNYRSNTGATALTATTGLNYIGKGDNTRFAGFNFQGVAASDMFFGRAANSDDLVISTSNTASPAERVRFTQSGNVGIGVTPSAWTSITPALQIKNASLYGFSTGELGLNVNAFYDGVWKYISNGVATQYVQASGNHQWFTAASGTAGNALTWVEYMRITSTGNVGIGTLTPGARLVVRTTANDAPGLGNSGGHFQLSNGEYGLVAGVGGSGNVYMQAQRTDGTATAYNLNLQPSGGNVNIGNTTNSNFRLNVVTNAVATRQNMAAIDRTAQNFVTFTNPQYAVDASMGILLRVFPQSDARQGAGIIASGGGNNGDTNLDLFVSQGTTTSTSYSAIRIEGATGNVGIGGSPLDRLTLIQDQNATTTARVRNSDTGSSAYAMVAVNASGNSWGMRMGSTAANSNALDFVSDALGTPTARMTITTAGNVGVGTTTPVASAKLDVASTTQGFLPPRMTSTQRAAITSPAVGLVVYQTDSNEGLWIYTSANGWKSLAIVV
jgi:hypothetical protein